MVTRAAALLFLNISEQYRLPFHHFVADRCLSEQVEADLLDWFESSAPWVLKETDFYEQYEFSLFNVDVPIGLSGLISQEELNHLRHRMQKVFSSKFSDKIDLVAHKLVDGQRIGIHNDYLEGQETHRLTIQINRGLSDDDGGFFMLFNSFDANDVHRILRPVSNSGVGFEISPTSHHAVSRIHGGERYTLVYSFYAE